MRRSRGECHPGTISLDPHIFQMHTSTVEFAAKNEADGYVGPADDRVRTYRGQLVARCPGRDGQHFVRTLVQLSLIHI